MNEQMQSTLFKQTFAYGSPWQAINMQSVRAGRLPSYFQTTELAVASIEAAAVGIADVLDAADLAPVDTISVNSRLASIWFNKSIQPNNWELTGIWDEVAGNYRCNDGWIRLHTNAPHHRKAAVKVLGCADNRDAVAAAVARWNAGELETAIVEAKGCAAEMRSLQAWQHHEQGAAVAKEPLIHWSEADSIKPIKFLGTDAQPLAGLRVLDLTRVLAGPVSTRFLAGFGADVLRIDPKDWNEPGAVPEVTLGKRCAHLDLKTSSGRQEFLRLIESADVLVHGYRPGALENLGLDEHTLRATNPGLLTVSLCAYGHTGPWKDRRGFDSLVQMSCGIASYGMEQAGDEKPVPLPVQALDHATGYLMAASALHAVAMRIRTGTVASAKLSLARTAEFLVQHKELNSAKDFPPVHSEDINAKIENTSWGEARRVHFPLTTNSVTAQFDMPASDLRSTTPVWLDR